MIKIRVRERGFFMLSDKIPNILRGKGINIR